MKRAFAVLPLLFVLVSSSHAAGQNGPSSIEDALTQARQQHKPVLLDFQAVWCYSCYYMASHVLNGKEWKALEGKTVVIEADADSPNGQAWMKKLKVSFLPTYVVLDEKGDELGRILAERPRNTFYPAIDAILAGNSRLDKLKGEAQKGSMSAVAAVLDAYQERGEGDEGMAWFATLPATVRNVSDKDRHVAFAKQRLSLLQAQAAKNDEVIVASAQKVLAGPIGCDRPYVVESLLEASTRLPAEQRKSVLAAQQPSFREFLSTQVLNATPACADQRSAIIDMANIDAAVGDSAGEKAVLDQAIASARQRLGGNLASDRNLADNLRVYLGRAQRTAELDTLQHELIAAYPDDYVFAYRYGRSLVDAGKPAEALPYLEQAAGKAYGANRFTVASVRVKALRALNRQADADKLVADTVAENGKLFPDQADRLKAALKS
jgi:hypothetical protein